MQQNQNWARLTNGCRPSIIARRHRGQQKWVARIKLNSKSQHLGYFSEEDEAARVFDEAATKLGRPTNFVRPANTKADHSSSSSSGYSAYGENWGDDEDGMVNVPSRQAPEQSMSAAAAFSGYSPSLLRAPIGRPKKGSVGRPKGKMRNSSSNFHGVHWNTRDVRRMRA